MTNVECLLSDEGSGWCGARRVDGAENLGVLHTEDAESAEDGVGERSVFTVNLCFTINQVG
jgi:hypothetical protein